jgi:hypothetical protein
MRFVFLGRLDYLGNLILLQSDEGDLVISMMIKIASDGEPIPTNLSGKYQYIYMKNSPQIYPKKAICQFTIS